MKKIQDEKRFFNDLMNMLEAHLGKDTELELKETVGIDDDTALQIADVRNGHITERKIGDVTSGAEAYRDTCNEFVHTEKGRILRCSNMSICGEDDQVIGELCINQDITRAVEAERYLRDYNMYRICDGGGIFPVDINSVLDDFIQEALVYIGKPVEEMKREDKTKFIQYLNAKGVFLITKSGTKVCNLLGISKYTLYNYLGRKVPRRDDE